MGTRTVQSILDRAWTKAHDQGINKRWPEAEGILWCADAQMAAVNLVPRAYTQTAVVTPVAGTRQTLAGLGLTRGLQLIDIPHNVAPSGSDSPAAPVTKVKRAFLDDYVPTWHLASGTVAEHWMTDEEDPKAFYIYPAISGGGRLRLIYAAMPTDLAETTDVIALDDIYAEAMQNYVLHCFFAKDLTSIKSAQLSQMYFTLFERALGIRDQKLSMTEAKSNAKQQGA